MHIANSADGRKILYDIDPIIMTEGAGKQAPTAVNHSLPQNGNGVKYSISDTDGKQLSKGQQDYFKDSKVRDENGNLKVVFAIKKCRFFARYFKPYSCINEK